MKYFLDTEFLEGTQKTFFGRETKPTIDLISIGIVCEDGREYYAISKDFNLKEVWNRFQLMNRVRYEETFKEYWIRENVLMPIIYDLARKDYEEKGHYMFNFSSTSSWIDFIKKGKNWEKTWLKRSKELITKYGKTNEQIAKDIKAFVGTKETISNWEEVKHKMNTEFYAYYADYDWVVFCWLFGKMMDLPKGFPKYCIDLKQILDEEWIKRRDNFNQLKLSEGTILDNLKDHPNYPKQDNEHNALADAKWNLELYKFLQEL